MNIFDELIDSVEDLSISPLPIQVIFPRMLGKEHIHSMSPRLVPPPDSSSAIDSRSRSTRIWWKMVGESVVEDQLARMINEKLASIEGAGRATTEAWAFFGPKNWRDSDGG